MRVLFCIIAFSLGAFKLSCRSITFTKPSSLPVFNIMLPWEEDLDEGLKTFLLRCACGPPSIFRNRQTRLCSMDGLCTAILKSKNLPFLPHWEKRNFRVGSFQGYQARCALSSTGIMSLKVFYLYERHGPEQSLLVPSWIVSYAQHIMYKDVKWHNQA